MTSWSTCWPTWKVIRDSRLLNFVSPVLQCTAKLTSRGEGRGGPDSDVLLGKLIISVTTVNIILEN